MSRTVESIEIYRAANQLIERFGDNAGLETAQLADAALDQGDRFNFNLWTRINTAVLQLQRVHPKRGEVDY
ncbi:MAG: hypothetical protein ABI824_18985 [Acidobacteriota bacterium]